MFNRWLAAFFLAAAPSGAAAAVGQLKLPDGQTQVTVHAEKGGNLLFVRVKVQGEDAGWFLADTGASHVTLDTTVADRLKLPVFSRAKARGVGAKQAVTIRGVGPIAVGPAVLRPGQIVAADLSSFTKGLGVTLSGLLGYDLWSQLPFTFDYKSATITFHARSGFQPPKDVPAQRLRIVARRPTVIGAVERKYRSSVMLDSGYQGTLSLHPLYLARYPQLAGSRDLTQGQTLGVGGEVKAGYAGIERLDILGQTFRSVWAQFPAFKPDPRAAAPHMAVLGAMYLRHFRLTFDYRTGRLWPKWLPQDAPRPDEVNTADFLGLTPLHHAARDGDAVRIGLLVKLGAKTDAKSRHGQTPLHVAVEQGHAKAVEALIAARADVDPVCNSGQTPLLMAVEGNRLAIVRSLAAAGAKLDGAAGQSERPLRLAVLRGHGDIVAALLEAGAGPDVTNAKGHTPLMAAVQHGHVEIARALIRGGAKVDAATPTGLRPLMLAVVLGRVEIVKLLIDSRAAVNAAGAGGLTPLMAAGQYGQAAAGEALLKAGAKVDLADSEGQTALMFAAAKGDLRLVRALLARRADANAKTKNGMTALRLARSNRHTQVAAALLRAGAR